MAPLVVTSFISTSIIIPLALASTLVVLPVFGITPLPMIASSHVAQLVLGSALVDLV